MRYSLLSEHRSNRIEYSDRWILSEVTGVLLLKSDYLPEYLSARFYRINRIDIRITGYPVGVESRIRTDCDPILSAVVIGYSIYYVYYIRRRPVCVETCQVVIGIFSIPKPTLY